MRYRLAIHDLQTSGMISATEASGIVTHRMEEADCGYSQSVAIKIRDSVILIIEDVLI